MSIRQHDHLAAPLFKTQDLTGQELCLTFDHLLTETRFAQFARTILSRVEAAYGRPVDIEFAWDKDTFYLLQCRSLSVRKEHHKVTIPAGVPRGNLLFTTHVSLSSTIVADLEYIVYVDPRAYDRLPTYEAKMRIAAAVNVLNKQLAGRRYALMGPGRWGSNDINLGVRVTYSNINKTTLLLEIAFAKEGGTPEVSYGTHFFQDLVEADITVVSLFPDDPGSFFNEDFVLRSENLLATIAPEIKECEEVVHVINVPAVRGGDYLQVYMDATTRRGMGVFGPRQDGGTAAARTAALTQLPRLESDE